MENTTCLNIDLENLTIWKPEKSNDRKVAIAYIHGGGLIFGNRHDLPKPYIELFLNEGFTIFSFDYPLAPETCLAEINNDVFNSYCKFIQKYYKKENFKEVFLFGRSAGAYLCLILAKKLTQHKELPFPKGVIDFYGYYDLKSPFLRLPSEHYNSFIKVDSSILDDVKKSNNALQKDMSQRYILYVYARQNGYLTDLWNIKEDDFETYSLTEKDFDLLPPLFITASSGDKDVPMAQSKALFRRLPKSRTQWVYYLEHDFDRNINDETGKKVYIECIKWIYELLEK